MHPPSAVFSWGGELCVDFKILALERSIEYENVKQKTEKQTIIAML